MEFLGPRRALYLCTFAAVFLCTVLAIRPGCANADFIRGDLNNDGRISMADLVYLIHAYYLGGPAIYCEDSGDIDDDGEVDLIDIYSFVGFLYSLNGGDPLPAPYPAPGPDPSDDELSACSQPGSGPAEGSDIEPIYYTYLAAKGHGAGGLAIAHGENLITVPVFMDVNVAVSGYTISIKYDTAQVLNAAIHFDGSIADFHNADIMASQPRTTDASEHFLLGYVVLTLFYSEGEPLSIPAGVEMKACTIELELSPDLAVGDVVTIQFQGTPPQSDEPEAPNEVVVPSLLTSFPQTVDIELPVVPESSLFIRGDVNRDLSIAFGDAIALLTHIFAPEAPALVCPDAADGDDDGAIGLVDVIRILEAVFLDASPLAAPFPYRGIDLGSDDLPCASAE